MERDQGRDNAEAIAYFGWTLALLTVGDPDAEAVAARLDAAQLALGQAIDTGARVRRPVLLPWRSSSSSSARMRPPRCRSSSSARPSNPPSEVADLIGAFVADIRAAAAPPAPPRLTRQPSVCVAISADRSAEILTQTRIWPVGSRSGGWGPDGGRDDAVVLAPQDPHGGLAPVGFGLELHAAPDERLHGARGSRRRGCTAPPRRPPRRGVRALLRTPAPSSSRSSASTGSSTAMASGSSVWMHRTYGLDTSSVDALLLQSLAECVGLLPARLAQRSFEVVAGPHAPFARLGMTNEVDDRMCHDAQRSLVSCLWRAVSWLHEQDPHDGRGDVDRGRITTRTPPNSSRLSASDSRLPEASPPSRNEPTEKTSSTIGAIP